MPTLSSPQTSSHTAPLATSPIRSYVYGLTSSARTLGSDPSDPDRAQGISLAETLDEYNNGVIGPGHCDS